MFLMPDRILRHKLQYLRSRILLELWDLQFLRCHQPLQRLQQWNSLYLMRNWIYWFNLQLMHNWILYKQQRSVLLLHSSQPVL